MPTASADETPAERMIATINDTRAEHGLRPLREAPGLVESSRSYARHLIATNEFGHGSSYRANGFRTTGEILAMRRGWSRRPRPVIRMWLDSSAHAELLLSPSFRFVGAAPARGRFGGPLTTVWVVHFGSR